MFSPMLIFTDKAFYSLSDMLLNSAQILAADSPVAGMKSFHVTRTVDDAVDMNELIFKTYPQAAVFNKIVLIEKRVQNADIFRIKEKPSSIFVSEKLKEATQNNKSRGFDFGEPAPLTHCSTK